MQNLFLIKMLLVIVIATAFLFSCNTEKRIYKKSIDYYEKHPDSLASICARKYPVEDSVALDRIDSIRPAMNVNYQADLDRMAWITDSIFHELQKSRNNNSNSLVDDQQIKKCEEMVSVLQKEIKSLKDKYKPCNPDSVYKTSVIYRKNTAELADLKYTIGGLQKQVGTKDSEIFSLQAEKNKKESKINDLRKDKLILIAILSIIGLAIGLLGVFKWKTGILNIFKK